MVGNLEAVLLAHCLHLADDLAHEALLDERRAQGRLQGDRDCAVALRDEAFRLCHRHLDVFGLQRDFTRGERELQLARAIKLILCLVSVDLCESRLDLADPLADLRPQDLELRFEAVAQELFHVVLEDDFLDVQLVLDDLAEEVVERVRRLNEHLADGLAVLDVRSVSRRTPQDDDL